MKNELTLTTRERLKPHPAALIQSIVNAASDLKPPENIIISNSDTWAQARAIIKDAQGKLVEEIKAEIPHQH
jgi:hypothetical protein